MKSAIFAESLIEPDKTNIRMKTSDTMPGAPRIPSAGQGWLALSPLLIFLAIYLISSVIARDFYKIPVAAAFLIASAYALIISKGKTIEERISVFSEGAGNKNVLLMLWIFILAGAFAETAKMIGAIDATVALTMAILP